jgi:hypothetical protein
MNCPFCGVVTDVPHETQGACIDALNAEIGRMRVLLRDTTLLSALVAPRKSDDDSERIPPRH